MPPTLDEKKYTLMAHLKAFDYELEKLAARYPLQRYPQRVELITSEQMLEALAAKGLPTHYSHWSFGKNFIDLKRAYTQNQLNLAYEIVINANPCIAYILIDNPLPLQVLVLAHACYGHSAFFKQNDFFKRYTDAKQTYGFLSQFKTRVKRAENKYGLEAVESIIDACHSLFAYGINHPHTIHNLPDGNTETINTNLLSFVAQYGKHLEAWEKSIIADMQQLATYFYPQQCTKLMNEGWACFWHYQLIQDLCDQQLLSDAFMLSFIEMHTQVLHQPSFAHPAFQGMNPYVLGFEIFNDIKRMCTHPTEEDNTFFPHLVHTSWCDTLQFAMQHYCDETFIMQYLSPHVIRKLRLFSVEDNPEHPTLTVNAIHNPAGYEQIRNTLAAQYHPSNHTPPITIHAVDSMTGKLTLQFHQIKHRTLGTNTPAVLAQLHSLWRAPIELHVLNLENHIVQQYTYPNAE